MGVDSRHDQRVCVSTRRPRTTPGRQTCLTRPPNRLLETLLDSEPVFFSGVHSVEEAKMVA